MKRVLVCSMAAAVCLSFAGIAAAGSMADAKIAVHLQPHNTNKSLNACDIMDNLGCLSQSGTSSIQTQGNLDTGYDVYVAVVDGSPIGVGGATFGISYDVPLFGSGLCANLDFPGQGWPASGGGNSITFDVINNCANGTDPTDTEGDNGIAVLYWFYVYAYSGPWSGGPGQSGGTFALTQRNVAVPDFKIADCTAAEDSPPFPLFAGVAGFGDQASSGYQPCVPTQVPVEESTWGSIKKQFGE